MIAPEPQNGSSLGGKQRTTIKVRVKRQDGPGQKPYWELHNIPYEPELNVISCLLYTSDAADE